jgi:hypothetical protein
MKNVIYIIFCLVLQSNLVFSQIKNDVILVSRAAIVLDSCMVKALDNFDSKTVTSVSKGSLLEYVSSSNDYMPNKKNVQSYKWYKVKDDKKVLGWIYGENLAISKNDRELNDIYKPYHKSTLKLGYGFEKSLIWFAATDGMDMDDQKNKSPVYDEFCVMTNQYQNNVIIHTSKKNVQGTTNLVKFKILPIISEKSNEILLQTTTTPSNGELPLQNIIIYSLDNGSLNTILDEPIDLRLDDYTKSPALCKIVEIEGNTVRFAYPDYLKCGTSSNTMCMSYKTNTLIWDKKKRQFKSLYNESEAPLAAILQLGTELKVNPYIAASYSNFLPKDTKVVVLEEVLNYATTKKGVKKTDIWFKVKSENGNTGFIPGSTAKFIGIEHSAVLNNYYTNTPLLRNEWKDSKDFVVIIKESNQVSQH